MTKNELNQDIRKLYKEFVKISSGKGSKKYPDSESMKKELNRLYSADRGVNNMTLSTLKMVLRMNANIQAIPHHRFGQNVEIN